MRFTKPALSFEDQLDRLVSRGLVVRDRELSIHYLSHINYYRLTSYLREFEVDHSSHLIRPGTTIEQLIARYDFDRELRLLLLDAIERIEVSIRTQWAYHTSHMTSPFGYLDSRYSASQKLFARNATALFGELERSKEPFVLNFKSKYQEPDAPPSWIASEVMSLGLLSHWYQNLRPYSVRKEISATYALNQQLLESVLHHLSHIRNLCAHHSRVWNREVVVTYQSPKKPKPLSSAIEGTPKTKIYRSLALVSYLMRTVSPTSTWENRLFDLLDVHRPPLEAMGFPPDWIARPLWIREIPN